MCMQSVMHVLSFASAGISIGFSKVRNGIKITSSNPINHVEISQGSRANFILFYKSIDCACWPI